MLAVATVGAVTPLVAGANPAGATALLGSCQGFAGCSAGGYTTHGYQAHMYTSWWRMYAGSNCTNYVAYVEATVYHAPTPGYLLGNAEDWPANAAAHGVRVDHTPSVGAVAVWAAGASGIPYPGHVAVVEQVAPGGGQIEISQDNVSAVDRYEWTRLTAGGVGSDGWMTWPTAFVHFVNAPATAPAKAAPRGELPPPAVGLVRDGDFASAAGWKRWPSSNFTTYARLSQTLPDGGSRFAATNTTVAGGGFYQDVPLRTSAGQSVCAEVEVVTVGHAWGARGVLALWLLGGSREDSAGASFGPLPGGSNWTPVAVCVTAKGPHDVLRVQIYDAPHTPTLGVDAVDAHLSLASGAWRAWPGSSYRVSNGVGAATSSTAGGGIYQDVHLAVGAGSSYCADAEVRGARGELVLWLLGGGRAEASGAGFGARPGRGGWNDVTTCVSATAAHRAVRIQLYVTPRSGTLRVAAVDVHRSLVADAGFDTAAGGAAWRVWPHSALASYLGGGHATVALEGAGFGVTNTGVAGGGIYQDLHYAVGGGTSLCADAAVVSVGRTRGARGELVLWLLGNGHPQAAAAAFGPLPAGNAWHRVGVCITASAAASDVRLQIYVAPHAPNLGVDAVDLR